MAQDWFEQNAPPVAPTQGQDWFAANAPPQESIGRTLKEGPLNIPSSAVKDIGSMAGGVMHMLDPRLNLMHPSQSKNTAVQLGALGLGEVENLLPQSWPVSREEVPLAKGANQMLKDRYGSEDAILRTLREDPFGVAADASTLFAAPEMGMGLAGKAGELTGLFNRADLANLLPKVAHVADVGAAASSAIDPVNLGMKALAPVAKFGVENVVKPTMGKVTGVGLSSLINPEPEMVKAMKGGVSYEGTVGQFKDALDNVKNKRAADYQSQLAQISKSSKPLDLTPVKQALAQKLQEFRIRPGAQPGQLDFSGSYIHSPADQSRVNQILNDVLNWGSGPGDMTPLGVDALKRRVGDFYSESSNARALVQGVKDSIRDSLNKQVPGYEKMTADYAKASDFIDAVTKEFSLDNPNIGTSIRKIQYALNQNNDYRQLLVEALDGYLANPVLKQHLAGLGLSRIEPRGIVGSMSAASLVGNLARGVIRPATLLAYALHSPRLLGETMRAIGFMGQQAKTVGGIASSFGIPGPTPLPRLLTGAQQSAQVATPRKKFFVTTGDKQTLSRLGYAPEDISQMTPAEAGEIIFGKVAKTQPEAQTEAPSQ